MGQERNTYQVAASKVSKKQSSIAVEGRELVASDHVEVYRPAEDTWKLGFITRVTSSEKAFIQVDSEVAQYYSADCRLPQTTETLPSELGEYVAVHPNNDSLCINPQDDHVGEQWSKARHAYWHIVLHLGTQHVEVNLPVVVIPLQGAPIFVVCVQHWGDGGWKWLGVEAAGSASEGWSVVGTKRRELQRKNIDKIYLYPVLVGTSAWPEVEQQAVGLYEAFKSKAVRSVKPEVKHERPITRSFGPPEIGVKGESVPRLAGQDSAAQSTPGLSSSAISPEVAQSFQTLMVNSTKVLEMQFAAFQGLLGKTKPE